MTGNVYSGRSHPWSNRIYERLRAAEDWVDREALLTEIAATVPDDAALVFARTKLRAPDRMDLEQLLESGRRGLVLRSLHNGRYQMAKPDGVWLVRLRPPGTVQEQMPRAEKWTQRAVEVLSDGQWHRREEVIGAMAKLIPPGKAHRKAERNRQHVSRRRPDGSGKPRVRERSDEFLIASGRRSIAAQALLRVKRIEREERNGEIWLRLRPDP